MAKDKQPKQDVSPTKDVKEKEVKQAISDFIETRIPSSKNKILVNAYVAKKTVKDTKGDIWELTEKRDKVKIEKYANSSDNGSELSYD